jgi:hypothetical protein
MVCLIRHPSVIYSMKPANFRFFSDRLKLITRGVDEDVAILPDEELLFKVKPKVDPLGALNPTDYSTSLRVSANGVSVCVPDQSQTKASYTNAMKEQMGVAPEREVYFWVYTDFYKWSLLTQGGKLALLVNVFADSSFSRRNEYVFRNKEAQRLSTAIEYFIEKFMSVMHIKLETTEGAFEGIEEDSTASPSNKGGMHNVNAEEWVEDEAPQAEVAMDLLGLDSSPTKSHNSANPFGDEEPQRGQASAQKSGAVDLFNDDPFGAAPARAPAPAPAPAARPAAADPFGDDPFGGPSKPSPESVPVATPVTAGAKPVDLFGGNDLMSAPAAAPVPPPAAKTNPLDLFESGPVAPPAAPGGPKTAPPLTQQQQAMHAQWRTIALMKNGGPLYDDGVVQVASQIEIRGSQGRVTFFVRNCSPANLSELNVAIQDPAGLLRIQAGNLPPTLGGLGQAQLQIMVECMKPVSPGPSVLISYVDSLHG